MARWHTRRHYWHDDGRDYELTARVYPGDPPSARDSDCAPDPPEVEITRVVCDGVEIPAGRWIDEHESDMDEIERAILRGARDDGHDD